EQKLSGIITRADLVRAYAEKYHGKYEVSDFMNQSPPTVTLSHSIFYVIDLMNESGIGKVVVVDGGKPVGVITKSDVMFMNIENLLSGSRLKFVKKRGISGRGFESVIRMYSLPIAGDVMSPNPITVRPSEDLSIAADVMTKNRIGTLPVVDDKGVLVGLLTKHDILNALRQV
ncbi:MAG: CBS domain-containing protein, partial [Zestosphaera sp.]